MKKSTSILLVAFVLLGVSASGCWKAQGILEQEGETDTDVDSDSDADADGDGDTDTDTGIPLPDCLFFVDVDSGAFSPDGSAWEWAFPDIQNAVDAADQRITEEDDIDFCEIWVRQGSYYIYGSSTEDTLRLRDSVHLYGGFAGDESNRAQRDWESNTTVLNGKDSTGGNLKVNHVITADSVSDVIFDGFTVTMGGATTQIQYMYGGGLTAQGSTILISNCSFVENTADAAGSSSGGGGVFLASCVAEVANCTFIANEAYDGAGLMIIDGEVSVFDSIFQANVAQWKGAGIYNISSIGSPQAQIDPTTIRRCIFAENQGASGTAVHSGSKQALIQDSYFLSNNASYVGGAIHNSQPLGPFTLDTSIYNSIFWNNTSPEGGAIALSNGSVVGVVNSTFRDNSGALGVIHVENDSMFEAWNSIFWNTGATEIVATPEDAQVHFCDVQGGFTGWHNIQEDPLFAGIDEDVTLAPGSPCVDAADGSLAPAEDIKGDPRVDIPSAPNVGIGPPWADMGAYEQSN